MPTSGSIGSRVSRIAVLDSLTLNEAVWQLYLSLRHHGRAYQGCGYSRESRGGGFVLDQSLCAP